MKLVFMGTPDFAASILERLIKDGHEIRLVVTQPDKAKGRSKELQPSEVKQIALREKLPVFQPVKMKTQETYDILASCEADAFIVAAYGRIIPKNILELPKYGCINVHASLLPKYRGAAPIQWAVLDGEERSGVTIMQMNEGLDTGDIISTREIELDKKETSDSLFDKLSVLGAELLSDTLKLIEKGEAKAVPQPEESPTPYARMITKADGKIDWNTETEKIERLVRGMNSWPGAYSSAGRDIVKIWECETVDEISGYEPGTVVRADKNALDIQAKDGLIRIRELQLQGKKRMSYDAFLRGNRWNVGMKLG